MQTGQVSVVLFGRDALGAEVALKVGIPHEEAATEAAALQAWDGDGAVRLHDTRDDGFTLLLDRLRPGEPPDTPDDVEEALTSVLPRLWSTEPATGVRGLADVARRWKREPPATFVELLERLLATTERDVLLHGDLHPGSVLRNGVAWLAIDPKPVVGDPAFDLAQALHDRVRHDVPNPHPAQLPAVTASLERWLDRLCPPLSLDPTRVLAWTTIKGWAWTYNPAFLTAAKKLHRPT